MPDLTVHLSQTEWNFLQGLLAKPHLLVCKPDEWPACDKTHLIFTDSSWNMEADDLAAFDSLRGKFKVGGHA